MRTPLDETIRRALGRDLGEWDVEGAGAASFARFQAAFPWVVPEALDDNDHGFESHLELTVFWQDEPGGPLREVRAADCGYVVFDVQSAAGSLVLYLNVFTDPLWLLTPSANAHVPDAELISRPQATHANRQRLSASLRAWEQSTGAEIVGWRSERLEAGIERYGVAADARAR